MLKEEQAQEILRDLSKLPADKIAKAHDFIRFLQVRYGDEQAIDESNEWSDEDLRDCAAASLRHAEESILQTDKD